VSISETNIVLKASEEIIESIEIGLKKAGVRIAKRELDTGEVKFLLPTLYWTMSVVYTVLMTYHSHLEGRIELPNGNTFPLSNEGLTQFRTGLLESMTERGEANIQIHQQNDTSFWVVYRDEVGNLIQNLPNWIDQWSASAAQIKSNVIWGIFFLLFATLAVVTALTWRGKISGEALVFLAGTIIGYIFAFMQKYLGITQTAS
jgi:hypothetical protein